MRLMEGAHLSQVEPGDKFHSTLSIGFLQIYKFPGSKKTTMQHVSTVPDTEVTKLSLPALLSQVCSCFGNLVFSICKIRANLCIGRESKNQVFLRTLLVTCKKENKTTKNPVWLQVDNSYRQNISRNNCINKENWFYHQTLTEELCLCSFQFA